MNVGEFLAHLATEHDTIAKVIVVVLHIAAGVISFMVITRRGWWQPTGPQIDWTTTADCPRCNEHGPFYEPSADLLASQERARDLHQAWHELTEALFGPVERCIHQATRRNRS